MSPRAEKFLVDALQLPEDERSVVAATLIDSLDQSNDPEAEKAWAAEINKRLSELDSGSVKGVSWPDARKAILQKS